MSNVFDDIPEALAAIDEVNPDLAAGLAGFISVCADVVTGRAESRHLTAFLSLSPVLAEIPELYDIAKRITLESGYSWYDPRTGERFDPK